MDQKLSEMEIKWLPKEVFDKDKINFGYEHINQLARVLQDHHERIDDETKARLAETIYHLDKDTANELARQSGNCIGYYFAMLALLDYQSQDVSIKWDLKNIIPTEYMDILSISNNSKKISKLKTKLENAELYRVLGWKAADFDKKIMGIQSF